MLLVEEGIEGCMEGLNLSLRCAAEESPSLDEVNGVVQHVQLWKCVLSSLGTPVLMDISHHTAPCINIACCPSVRTKQAVMQLLQPARKDRVRGFRCCRDVGSGCEECSTAFSLDPLADFGPVEIVEIALPAATSGMHRGDCLQRCLEALLAQQLAECVENDAITDTEEEMERSRNDALGRDGEEWLLATYLALCAIEQ